MSEKQLVINGLQLNYKGVFEFDELMRVINKSVMDRGYSRHEKKFDEQVLPEGKNMFIELRPMKKKTNYYGLMIKMRMTMKNLTEVQIEIDGIPRMMNQGEIDIIFDAWTTTDYESRWATKPWFYFLKAVMNKYIYKLPLESGFPGEVASDTRYVYDQVRAALGLYKYKVSK